MTMRRSAPAETLADFRILIHTTYAAVTDAPIMALRMSGSGRVSGELQLATCLPASSTLLANVVACALVTHYAEAMAISEFKATYRAVLRSQHFCRLSLIDACSRSQSLAFHDAGTALPPGRGTS